MDKMRVRRWVVYRMDALPEPDDLVHKEGRYFTKRGAERARRRFGPNLQQWMMEHSHAERWCIHLPTPVYWQVSHAPGKLFGWRTRRWLRRHVL